MSPCKRKRNKRYIAGENTKRILCNMCSEKFSSKLSIAVHKAIKHDIFNDPDLNKVLKKEQILELRSLNIISFEGTDKI